MRFETNLDILKKELPKCERRIKAKKEQIEDLQNECELLKRQEFDLLKSRVYYFGFDVTMKSAHKGFWMLKNDKDTEGNKLDKREKYKEIESYKNFKETLKEILGIADIDIISMMDYNYGQAEMIDFGYLDRNWEIEIPYPNDIRYKKGFDYYGVECFKISLRYETSESCYDCIGSTFDLIEVKDIMKQGIEKYIAESE